MNEYAKNHYRYLAMEASDATLKECKAHWGRTLSAALETGNEDMVNLACSCLAVIAMEELRRGTK